MWIYILLCVVVVIFAILFTIFIINKNKFQVLLVKLNEVEENIIILLKEKYNILLEIEKFIKKKEKDNPFEELENINIEELNNFELSNELSKYDNSVIEYANFNKNIKFSESEIKSFEDYESKNIECAALEKYYNDNASKFNNLISSFPTNLIAKIKRYKQKEYYLNEKEEIFEILKK